MAYFLPFIGAINSPTPPTILGSSLAWWLDADVPAGTLVDAGGGVASAWNDSSGNSVNFSFASGHRPTINATSLNGKTTVAFSTSQYGGVASYVTPAPGTQFSYFFFIFKVPTVIAGRILSFNAVSSSAIYIPVTAISDFNGGAGASSNNVVANTWYRLEVLRSNSATDYVTLNGVGNTLANAGNNAGTLLSLNADPGGSVSGDANYAEAFSWRGASPPTTAQRNALAAYSLAKWGV